MLQFVGDNAAEFTHRSTAMSPRPASAPSSAACSQLEATGRREVLRRAGARTSTTFMQTDATAAASSTSSPPTSCMTVAAAVRDASCCGCCPSCSSTCPRSATVDKPKLVFFFDEAHLLFDDAPQALLEKIEQVVRLIRSKGVGVYLRHAEPARHSRQGARPARQPRAARAARLHAARPEGGEGGGETFRAEPEARHRDRRSPSSASARRWSRCSTRRAGRASWSARS